MLVLLVIFLILRRRGIRCYFEELPIPEIVDHSVIVSLTTSPSRSRKIASTLYSLLDQSYPLEIEIHIPVSSEYKFPERVINHPNIKIISHAEDPGPSMKYIPAVLKANKDIIVVNDDMIYPRDLNEHFVTSIRKLPDYVYANRGNRFVNDTNNSEAISSAYLVNPVQVAIVTGGYVIPKKIASQLRHLINDYSTAPPEAKLMDDIWISGNLTKLGIKKFVLPGLKRHANSVITFSSTQEIQPGKLISYFKWAPDEIIKNDIVNNSIFD